MRTIDMTPTWGEWANIYRRFVESGEAKAVRELEARPDYFAGKNPHRGLATDTPPGLDASVTHERATQ